MIDTKKAREMRAKGTAGEWHTLCDERGYSVATEDELCCFVGDWEGAEEDAELIAYAVNNIIPMVDEIDRLRAALRLCSNELSEAQRALNAEGLYICGTARLIAIEQADTILGDSK